MEQYHCAICEGDIEETHSDERNFYSYKCQRCGNVRITDEAAHHLNNHPELEKYKLSGIVRERTELGMTPVEMLTSNIAMLISSAPDSLNQKMNKIVLHISRKSRYPGALVNLGKNDYPIGYARNYDEFRFLIEALEDKGYIQLISDSGGNSVVLNLSAWEYIEQINRVIDNQNQAFVAMWFNPDLQEAFEVGIAKAIKACGFNPLRIDMVHHNDKIDDRIISEIKRSNFLVADFTGHRGGVYFEVGYAMGLGLPVIWTCKSTDIESAHFDTRQYNHIVWDSPEELYQKLKDRITATIL